MKHIGFVMSMLLSMLGILLLSFGLLVPALLPSLAAMAYSFGSGAFVNLQIYKIYNAIFELGFWFYMQQSVAVLSIVVGGALSLKCSLTAPNR